MPHIDIVIVNWNAGLQLKRCVQSINTHHQGLVNKIIVVDNASTDDSLTHLEEGEPRLEIIRNSQNFGFAKACNQGAKRANSKYLLFLNPDTELFDNSLAQPLDFMERRAENEVGICGIQLIGENGKVSRSCARFPSLSRFTAEIFGINKLPGLKGSGVHMKEWDHSSTREVDHVIGAFFFMKRQLFLQLDGFDERFFVYLEDVDFSVRARKAGWKTFYLADAQAFHLGGGTSRRVKARRLYYALRSRLLFGYKHFNSLQAWTLLALTLFAEPVTRTLFCLAQGNPAAVKDTALAYVMLYRALPDILVRSRACQK